MMAKKILGLFYIAVCLVLLLPAVCRASVGEDGQDQMDHDKFENDSSVSPLTPASAESVEDRLHDFVNVSRNTFIMALMNLSNDLPLSVQYAVTVGQKCDIMKYNKPYYSKVGLILAAVLILLGILFTFFGYRLIKIVLFFIGFLVGAAITYFIVLAFTQRLTEPWIPYVALSGAVVVGVVCGIVTICIYYIGLFLAGSSIGFIIAWFIMASIDVPFFRTHIYVPILVAIAAGVIVGILTLIMQKWFFILGTAILGSFMAVWGLDYYLELGSMIYFLFLFAEHRTDFKPCWYSWSILPLFIILIICGILIQALVTGRKYDHKKHNKGVCCGLCKKKKTKTVDKSGKYMKLENKTAD